LVSRESEARLALRLTLARTDATLAYAAQLLDDLDRYLAAVRATLRRAGYLTG
jgi:hypothetical protein